MSRYRRRKTATHAFLDVLPQLGGLVLLGILFVPAFRELLGLLFVLLLWLLGVVLVGGLIWLVLRHHRRAEAEFTAKVSQAPPPSPPTPRQLDEVRTLDDDNANVPEWTGELLRSLEWKRFEELVTNYYREQGQSVRTTRLGPDGGVDAEVLDRTTDEVVMLIQCKAWNAYPVGVKPMRELFGVMAARKVMRGAFFTTGEFTREALNFARENNLEAVDGDELISRIRQLPKDGQRTVYTLATAGDYTTPTCPSCGIKMMRRDSSGRAFLGCPNYPRCRQTFHLTRFD